MATAAHIAIAAEGINRIPDLSPIARRLAQELIGRTDRKKGTCFPSEARLALSLGCDERSIRRAKVELRERGFLTWQNRGRYQTPLYRVMFAAIVQLAQEIKRKIRQAFLPASPPPDEGISGHYKPNGSNDSHNAPPTQSPIFGSRKRADEPGRTLSPAYPSQFKKINGFEGKGAGATIAPRPRITPEQAAKNAEKRFWADLMRLPRETFIALTASMTPEQQESAVQSESRKFGTGVSTILDALKAGDAA